MPNDTVSRPDLPEIRLSRSDRRREAALGRVRAVAEAAGVPGVVLTRPGPVAWASGGINPPIDRTAPVDTVWLAVTPGGLTVITNEVEAPRIRAELAPEGAEVVAVPWWDADALAAAATDVVGADRSAIGADGHPAFGRDLDHRLAVARLPLSDADAEELRELGADAAVAVEEALRAWRPGETDREIAARIAAAVERTGADAPCLLVGGDERMRRFRHPVADGSRPAVAVMAVLVARRAGLHVALTRHALAAADAGLERGMAVCRSIHRGVLAACRPGAHHGAVLDALAAGYAAAGAPGEWRAHYQGGPIGFAQREFEIAPGQTGSPWWDEPLSAGVAVAWNPSLPGGAKDEDTYLVRGDGVELVTTTGTWPEDAAGPGALPRPAVLEVGR
jgi:Xaa-Pro aminopeptidase